MTEEQKKIFNRWQWRTIIGSMIGYAVFYFVRKNFSVAIPGLTAEYGITKQTFGILLALGSFIYGVSKLINGFLADTTNARWHMVTGLSVSAVTNLLFGAGAVIAAYFVGADYGAEFTKMLVLLFSVLFIVNQIFQGCGFSPCNRLMTHWVAPNELATKMSLWNTSHSIGAFIAVGLSGWIMGHMGTNMVGNTEMEARIVENTQNVAANIDSAAYQSYVEGMLSHVGAWQWTFIVPGIIAVLGVLFIIVVLRDTPSSVGLPELKGTKKDEGKSTEAAAEHRRFVWEKVVKNPIVWVLALMDFWVYIARMAILDWGPTFLQELKGFTPGMAASAVAISEVFGIVGMIIWGVVSDKVFKGRSQRTCVFCMLGAAACLAGFAFAPTGSVVVIITFMSAAAFCFYGPQALAGIIASNHVTRRGASSAVGIISFVCYLAPIISGWLFGMIADNPNWGWQVVLNLLILAAVAGMVTVLPLWRLKADAYDEQ